MQEFLRVAGSKDADPRGNWFVAYNHDVEHPYFAPRAGFVRAHMKYQGMVGISEEPGKTRLTWLINVDFGGLIPSSFAEGLLVSVMVYPLSVAEDAEAYGRKKVVMKDRGGLNNIPRSSAVEELDNESGKVSRQEFNGMREDLELKATLAKMKAELVDKDEELRSQNEELRRKDEELRRKDEELRRRNQEHQNELADKEEELRRKDDELKSKGKQIMELRKRLPRVVN